MHTQEVGRSWERIPSKTATRGISRWRHPGFILYKCPRPTMDYYAKICCLPSSTEPAQNQQTSYVLHKLSTLKIHPNSSTALF